MLSIIALILIVSYAIGSYWLVGREVLDLRNSLSKGTGPRNLLLLVLPFSPLVPIYIGLALGFNRFSRLLGR